MAVEQWHVPLLTGTLRRLRQEKDPMSEASLGFIARLKTLRKQTKILLGADWINESLPPINYHFLSNFRVFLFQVLRIYSLCHFILYCGRYFKDQSTVSQIEDGNLERWSLSFAPRTWSPKAGIALVQGSVSSCFFVTTKFQPSCPTGWLELSASLCAILRILIP